MIVLADTTFPFKVRHAAPTGDMTAFYEKWGFKAFHEGQLRILKAQREG